MGETVRAYAVEPVLSGLAISLLVNWLGIVKNVEFMQAEAKDILSLGVVLLGAALALWIGLFWISGSEFGQWLASRRMLEPINNAYVASAVVLLIDCVLCVLCAHVPSSYKWLQISGEFFSIWGLVTMYTLLNNTRLLLKLRGQFGTQPRSVSGIRSSAN